MGKNGRKASAAHSILIVWLQMSCAAQQVQPIIWGKFMPDGFHFFFFGCWVCRPDLTNVCTNSNRCVHFLRHRLEFNSTELARIYFLSLSARYLSCRALLYAQIKLQMEKPKSIKFNLLHVSAEWPTNITISRVSSRNLHFTLFKGRTPGASVLCRRKNVRNNRLLCLCIWFA